VKPTVEDAFLRQQHLLALLDRAIDTTQTAPTQMPAFDQQTAQALWSAFALSRRMEPTLASSLAPTEPPAVGTPKPTAPAAMPPSG
jgi:hypothetical protein